MIGGFCRHNVVDVVMGGIFSFENKAHNVFKN